MIAVTGANGNLGQIVIQELLKTKANKSIVAIVRNPEKADTLQKQGVQIRLGDYDNFESMHKSLLGVESLLLISSSEIGKRAEQHQKVINAAKEAGVKNIVYTSILNAQNSKLKLALEHQITENQVIESGLSYSILRNGWYLENHTENLDSALQFGQIMGAAGDGKFSSASRADFALAAANVLSQPVQKNKIYELAGEDSFSLKDLAKELSLQTAKKIEYKDLSEEDYKNALIGFGLAPAFADILADSDHGAKLGQLESHSKDLHELIGRKTTSLSEAIRIALKAKY